MDTENETNQSGGAGIALHPFVSPYYDHGGITIYHGDCKEILPHLGNFDLLLTDPPYGVLPEKWDKFTEPGFNVFNGEWMSAAAKMADNAVIFSGSTRSNIETMARLMFENVRRVIWDKGSSATGEGAFWFCYEEFYLCSNQEAQEFAQPKFLNVGNAIKAARVAKDMSRGAVDMVVRGKKTGLCYRWEEGACLPTDEQTAVLEEALQVSAHGYHEALAEALAARDETLKEMRQHNSDNGARFSDVLKFPVKKETNHPCEKPIGLMRTIIEAMQCRSIVDPFMGSGTTLRAAKDMGKRAVGIELDERYCEIAAHRLSQEVLPLG